MSIVEEILETFLFILFQDRIYEVERRKSCPIFQAIDDWQLSKNNGQEKPESELIQEILQLLKNGADVHEPEYPPDLCNVGYTPILKASEAGAFEVVKTLIQKGANVNDKLSWGYKCTSLAFAIKYNNLELVKILVKNGANLESRDEGSNTPLLRACMTNRLEIVEVLVKNGAELNSHPYWGSFQYGFELTPLHITILRTDSLKIMKLLIQYGANLDKQSTQGHTALLMALFEGQFEMAKVLIKNGANVNFININSDGQSPLHLAATKNDPSLTKMLIDHGAEINTKSIHGEDALQLSLDFQKHENFKLIMFKNHQ